MKLSILALLLSSAFLAAPPLASAAVDPTSEKVLYVAATAHLDDQWNWTIQDTINNYIPKTLQQNFTLFTNYPGYTFSFEEAWRYRIIREYYPDQFLTMSNYIAQGRWRLTGSSLVAGDVNIPSPESLFRQILYAQKYWSRTFGKTSTDIFLPDCFGFGYALPSIASHSGLKGFSTQKLAWGSSVGVPFQNIGRWEGVDGSSIVAVLAPGSYTSTIGGNLANDTTYQTRIDNMYAATGLSIDYRYFGTGDTGGAPDTSSVNWLQQSIQTTNGLIKVLSTGADQIFRDLTPAHVSMLPSYKGELLLKTHGSGCYTAHPQAKLSNRQNELRADAAERAAIVADWLQGGGTYPAQRLNQAWTRFLWHQFHDDLTGTSIPQAYPFSWNDYAISLNEFGSEQTHAVGVLAQAMDTAAQGVPLLVVNSLGISRTDLVDATVVFPNGVPDAVRVFDPSGTEVPSQAGQAFGNSLPVTFLATVPANGAAVYDVRPASSPSTLPTGLSVSESRLENARYRVDLNSDGDVSGIYDKTLGRQLLSAPIRWEFLNDRSTTWPAWEIIYQDTATAAASRLGAPAMREIAENGPARVSLVITRANAGSTFSEKLSLAAGASGDRLEWDVTANWGSRETLLKVRFPLAAANPNATYDLGLGTIQRPNSQPNLYEVPAQQWADLTHSNNTFGVSVMNDSRYGWDKPDNNTLRLTLFHSPAVGGSYVYQATNGFGTHRLGFALAGHPGDWRSGSTPWVAARFNQRLQAFQTAPHAGALGKTFEFLSCNNSNVMIKAVKKAEDTGEIIVRLQELTGSAQVAQLAFASQVASARLMTGAEEPLSTLTPVNGRVSVPLSGYAPATVAIILQPSTVSVPKPASLPVALPFNMDVISTDANRGDGQFAGGFSYAAELMPSTLERAGVSFNLGSSNNGQLNALSCQGQTIPLSTGGFTSLYFLAASAASSTTATFAIGTNSVPLTIPYFTGFMGQWGSAPVVTNELAWIGTHRHTATANDAYRFTYLYLFRMDVPAGAGSIVLPNAPDIRIFAMSLANNPAAATLASGGALAENLSPWANAGADQRANASPTTRTATVTLNGSASRDPDGSILSYSWSKDGIALASGPKPQVDLPIGTNNLVLAVTDDRGARGFAEVTIVVRPPLSVSVTAGTPTSQIAPATVAFTGQASSAGLNIPPFDTTDDLLGTITAQGQNTPNELARAAFDNSDSTKWLDFANNYPDSRSSWIQYQYASGVAYITTNYTLTSANDAPERDPSAWALLASNDGGATWTTLDTRTNQSFSDRLFTRSFAVNNSTPYSTYRLRIDKVRTPTSANSVQLAEIELLGTAFYTFFWNFGDGSTSSSSASSPSAAVQHTYSRNGTFTVTLGASFAGYTGTNSTQVTIGQPLAAQLAADRTNGALPLAVHFTGQALAGSGGRVAYDPTDDGLGGVTAQGENSPNETAAKLFDNNPATKWLDFANAFPSTRSSWVQYQYPSGQRFALTQYSITSAADSSVYPARNPAAWRLLGSNDDGYSWDTIDVKTGQYFSGNNRKLTWQLTNTNAYNVHRLQIDSVSNAPSASCLQIADLDFVTVPTPYAYTWDFGDGSGSALQNPVHTFTQAGQYRASLVVWDGLSSATNSMLITVGPAPSIAWEMSGAGGLVLTWPDSAAQYSLESATNLTPPISWSAVSNIVNSSGGLLRVDPGPVDPNTPRFFRLRANP